MNDEQTKTQFFKQIYELKILQSIKENYNCVSDIIKLIEKYNLDINIQDQYGDTVLHKVARFQDITIFDYLINVRKANINVQNNMGWTPLFEACHDDISEIDQWEPEFLEPIEFLLKSGADMNIICDEGWGILQIVAFNGNIDILKLLIKYGAKIDETTEKGETLLQIACEYGQLEIFKFLSELLWNLEK